MSTDLAALDELHRRLEAREEAELLPIFQRLADALPGADPEDSSRAVLLAARCIELRARSLLPAAPPEPAETEAPDELEAGGPPPAELAERLAAYEAYRSAADLLRSYEARWSQRFPRAPASTPGQTELDVSLDALLSVFQEVWERARPSVRSIVRERLSVEARIEQLRGLLRGAKQPLEFGELFADGATRLEVVVTFLALLELMRLGDVQARQEDPSSPLRLHWAGRGPSGR